MLDNLLLLLNYARDNLIFDTTFKSIMLIFFLRHLRDLLNYTLGNFYFRNSINIYSNCYLILKNFIYLNASLFLISYSISLIFGGLANSSYCFIHVAISFFLFFFNILILFYLYKKINFINFIIILNFILLFNLSFLFEFIYGVNPIPNIFSVVVDPKYVGMGFYDRYDIFYDKYFEEVDFNIKHPGVLQKFM